MLSYQTGKHYGGSSNSNQQTLYSNDNPRVNKPNYIYPPYQITQPQYSQSQYENGDREPQHHFGNNGDRQNHSFRRELDEDRNLEINTERNGERRTASNHITSNIDTKFYTCPSCNSPFDYRNRFGQYTGKLPLILNCNHTVCQECIHKGAVEDNIVCPICKKRSAFIAKNHMENLYETFSPDFYIFGMISFSKGTSYNSDRFSLVPEQESKRNHNFGLLMERKQDIGQRCCFISCNKDAKLRCEDCNDVYCTDCSTNVHKSAKTLGTHTQVPLIQEKPTRELERCTLQEIDIENCEEIDKQAGHEKDNLSKQGGCKKGGSKKDGSMKGGSGYTKVMNLSPELAALVGQDTMVRHQVVKKVWSIIKEKDLYDPNNKQFAICDDALMKVIGVKRFRTFGLMKYLNKHFSK